MSKYHFAIKTDVERNVVYIQQQGLPCASDLVDLKHEYLAAVRKMRPGFSIVNDQREMEPYDDEAMKVAVKLVEITNRHEASRVIRIVPANVLSTLQLTSTLEAGRARYSSIRVASPEEAEEALDTFSVDVTK